MSQRSSLYALYPNHQGGETRASRSDSRGDSFLSSSLTSPARLGLHPMIATTRLRKGLHHHLHGPAFLILLLLLVPEASALIPPPPPGIRGSGVGIGPLGGMAYPIRVAFQGESGAYSEKALRELLGPHVIAFGKPAFEDVFKVCTQLDVGAQDSRKVPGVR